MGDALRDELLSVPGIAGAEVESDQGVAGVRVQLAAGADADTVGAAVRRILAEHGMRPVVTDGAEQDLDGPPPPPGAPGSVVSFPLVGEHAAKSDGAAVPKIAPEVRLEGVAVEETPDGMSVAVRLSDGRSADRTLPDVSTGLDDGVVAAVAELRGFAAASLTEVSEMILGDTAVVAVLLTVDGHKTAGAAIQLGGRAYAVACAAWIALDQAE